MKTPIDTAQSDFSHLFAGCEITEANERFSAERQEVVRQIILTLSDSAAALQRLCSWPVQQSLCDVIDYQSLSDVIRCCSCIRTMIELLIRSVIRNHGLTTEGDVR
jgi:hypothetical protein